MMKSDPAGDRSFLLRVFGEEFLLLSESAESFLENPLEWPPTLVVLTDKPLCRLQPAIFESSDEPIESLLSVSLTDQNQPPVCSAFCVQTSGYQKFIYLARVN
jgi:hypothetical protein